jgi:hypothetical protein
MEKRNLNEPNPKLKEGDRIILIYMMGEDISVGSKGVVVGINGQPRFKPTDSGMGIGLSSMILKIINSYPN